MSTPHYRLVNSEEKAKKHPGKWLHPPKPLLDQITKGFWVKIAAEADDLTTERFWCKVIHDRNVPGAFFVKVDQDLEFTSNHGLKDEDTLYVRDEHIFGIISSNQRVVFDALRNPPRIGNTKFMDSDTNT